MKSNKKNKDKLEKLENNVVSFLNKKMLADRNNYSSPTEWDDFSWIVDEIHQFLEKNYNTSYTLKEFGNKYDYDTLTDIIINNFKSNCECVLSDNLSDEVIGDYSNLFKNFG